MLEGEERLRETERGAVNLLNSFFEFSKVEPSLQ
jgi:hypothetical protein